MFHFHVFKPSQNCGIFTLLPFFVFIIIRNVIFYLFISLLLLIYTTESLALMNTTWMYIFAKNKM